MRTTLDLDSDVYEKAVQATGIVQKTRLIHMGLEALIRESAANRLALLKGVVRQAKASQRRRS